MKQEKGSIENLPLFLYNKNMVERNLSKEEIEELNRKAYETCAWEITTEVEDVD